MISRDLNLKDLQRLRIFMNEQNITLTYLGREMDYTLGHLIKVFNGNWEIHDKFTRRLLKAFQHIFKDDIENLTFERLKDL